MGRNPDLHDFSVDANLRAAFDVWPKGRALPRTAEEVARAGFALLLRDLLHDRAAPLNIVRFADDGVSIWMVDNLGRISLDDFVRAVAQIHLPPAHAIAALQPMRAEGDAAIHGVHCRAAFHDDIVELAGEVEGSEGPPEGRSVPKWKMRSGRVNDDRGRWIGVKPTIEIELPMLGAAES